MMFGKKLKDRLDRLRHVGHFTAAYASEKEMRLVTGREGDLCLYWLVDESDGIIADTAFQVFGPIALIAAAELASELALRKTYDQASRISVELIDQHLRDKKETPAFPSEARPYLLQVVAAIGKAHHQCLDIPFAAVYESTPLQKNWGPGEGIAGWKELSADLQKKIIEEAIDREIRPYIELDAGGVTVLSITNGRDVKIAYQGSCTSCPSSIGSTLSAIQQILQAKVHADLTVTPDLAFAWENPS